MMREVEQKQILEMLMKPMKAMPQGSSLVFIGLKSIFHLMCVQVDYILGDNPRATSYMVGYGNNYPRQVHHRAASIVSYKVDSSFVSCRGGYATWFSRKASDPNLLTGALVGGPDAYDNFADQRDNYEQTEPATYNNAPLLGILARLGGGHSGYNQLLPGKVYCFQSSWSQ